MALTLPPLIVTPEELVRIARDTNPALAALVEQFLEPELPDVVRVPASLLNLTTT